MLFSHSVHFLDPNVSTFFLKIQSFRYLSNTCFAGASATLLKHNLFLSVSDWFNN